MSSEWILKPRLDVKPHPPISPAPFPNHHSYHHSYHQHQLMDELNRYSKTPSALFKIVLSLDQWDYLHRQVEYGNTCIVSKENYFDTEYWLIDRLF